MKTIRINQLLVCLMLTIKMFGQASWNFSLAGHTAYHVSPGKIGSDAVVFSATYDGMVFCHTQSGTKLWEAYCGLATETRGFPFDVATGDIDNDGKDEVFVASSNGTLYAFDDNGANLWKFVRVAPLYQVKVLVEAGSVNIYTGGIDQKLFRLNSDGALQQQIALDGAVRLIRFGKILNDGKTQVAVLTTRNALSGSCLLYLYDQPTLTTEVWNSEIKYKAHSGSGRFYSMEVFDINGDGKEEMVMGHDHTQPEAFTIVNSLGTFSEKKASEDIATGSYKMCLYRHIKSNTLGTEYLMNHYGDKLILMQTNGTVVNQLDAPYSFTNSAFDPETNTLFFSSELSGGDGIFAFKLDNQDWKTAFTSIQPIGKMITLEANMKILSDQVNAFNSDTYPYQSKVAPIDISTTGTSASSFELLDKNYSSKYKNLSFCQTHIWAERDSDPSGDGEGFFDRSGLQFGWDTKRDDRRNYDMSSNEIENLAKIRESNNNNFILWIGHGSDPFYMSLATLEKVLIAAPTTCKGFYFAELEQVNANMQYVINTHIIPLAELCLKYGKRHLILQNKNIFWNGSIYTNMWQALINNPKFKDVIIPSLEETNTRTQSMSIYGRMGLRMVDQVSTFGVRPVTDNANFVRTFEWCYTEHLSHQIRTAMLGRILGANTYIGAFHTRNEKEMMPFYGMVDKGILPLSDPSKIISVSDLAIGMKTPPDAGYIENGINGNVIKGYKATDPKMVFDRLDCFWGGALTPEWDFNNYAFNCKRQMTNFIAQAPYGNIAMIPANTDLAKFPRFKKMIVTDGKNWFDESGNVKSPEEYKSTVLAELESAAERLPVRVSGEVSWAAVQMDATHYRIVLIDPGYLDPADREATITFNGLSGIEAEDILQNETLNVVNNQLSLTVPMGILRIVDVKFDESTAVKTAFDKNITIYPNPVTDELHINTDTNKGEWEVELFDLKGNTLAKEMNKKVLFLKQLNSGVYLLKVKSDTNCTIHKIVKT